MESASAPMIIKSMRRKQAQISQLLGYIDKSAVDDWPIYWNVLETPKIESGANPLTQVFQQQLQKLQARRGGNQIYHEIISLKKHPQISLPKLKRMLYYLLMRYLDERAPQQLGYGRLHVESHHIHLHLVLSANALYQKRPVRLSRERFREIQQNLTLEMQELFPELELEHRNKHQHKYKDPIELDFEI